MTRQILALVRLVKVALMAAHLMIANAQVYVLLANLTLVQVKPAKAALMAVHLMIGNAQVYVLLANRVRRLAHRKNLMLLTAVCDAPAGEVSW